MTALRPKSVDALEVLTPIEASALYPRAISKCREFPITVVKYGVDDNGILWVIWRVTDKCTDYWDGSKWAVAL